MVLFNEWLDKTGMDLELLTSSFEDPDGQLTLEEQQVLVKVLYLISLHILKFFTSYLNVLFLTVFAGHRSRSF